VNRETGRPRLVRAVAAVDSGQVVNPDGLINQIEVCDPAVDELDALRKRHLRRYKNYEHRLADLSDPAVQLGPRKGRGCNIINRPGLPFLGSGCVKPGRARLRHRLRTRSPTQPESGCAICR